MLLFLCYAQLKLNGILFSALPYSGSQRENGDLAIIMGVQEINVALHNPLNYCTYIFKYKLGLGFIDSDNNYTFY